MWEEAVHIFPIRDYAVAPYWERNTSEWIPQLLIQIAEVKEYMRICKMAGMISDKRDKSLSWNKRFGLADQTQLYLAT